MTQHKRTGRTARTNRQIRLRDKDGDKLPSQRWDAETETWIKGEKPSEGGDAAGGRP